jgi:hypothetical protein
MSEKVTDDMLMALADDELDAATARDLRERVERDPELARRYAVFGRSGEATRAAFARALREQPPAGLADAIRRHGRPAETPVPRSRGSLWQLPMAAIIALAAGLTGYFLRGTDDAPRDGFAGLDTAFASLAGTPAGQVVQIGNTRAVVLESYDTAIGPCRIAQLRDEDGGLLEAVGCLRSDAWQVELAQRPIEPDATVPADGVGADPGRAFLDRLGADAPLGPADEEERVRQGW